MGLEPHTWHRITSLVQRFQSQIHRVGTIKLLSTVIAKPRCACLFPSLMFPTLFQTANSTRLLVLCSGVSGHPNLEAEAKHLDHKIRLWATKLSHFHSNPVVGPTPIASPLNITLPAHYTTFIGVVVTPLSHTMA
jgi:hypothetical protein